MEHRTNMMGRLPITKGSTNLMGRTTLTMIGMRTIHTMRTIIMCTIIMSTIHTMRITTITIMRANCTGRSCCG